MRGRDGARADDVIREVRSELVASLARLDELGRGNIAGCHISSAIDELDLELEREVGSASDNVIPLAQGRTDKAKES